MMLSNINIKKEYADVLDKYDLIANKEVFHTYNTNIPKPSDSVYDGETMRVILNIIDDGKSYLINWCK